MNSAKRFFIKALLPAFLLFSLPSCQPDPYGPNLHVFHLEMNENATNKFGHVVFSDTIGAFNSKFKVGDIVRVRDLDKIEKETQSRLPFGRASEMDAMVGRLCTITGVEPHRYEASDFPRFECDGCRYRISSDEGRWAWSSPMLEKVTEPVDLRVDVQGITTKTNVEPYALTPDGWKSYFDSVLFTKLSGVCSVPSALMPKKDDEPLIAVKKHSVKLNFKN
jgi:hypothetical protein